MAKPYLLPKYDDPEFVVRHKYRSKINSTFLSATSAMYSIFLAERCINDFVRGLIWHLYARWFDGNPAHLKPAPATALAAELASLAGGTDKMAERAAVLAAGGRTRLAAPILLNTSTTMANGYKGVDI